MRFIATLAAVAYANTWEQDVELAAGVMFGLSSVDHYEEMLTCMIEADIFALELMTAFDVVLAAGEDDEGMTAGYRMCEDVVNELPYYLEACGDIAPTDANFFFWPFKLVGRILYNTIHHLPMLALDSLMMYDDYEEGKYFAFGHEIEKVLKILLQPIPKNGEDLHAEALQ